MEANRVVVLSPGLDDDLRLAACPEPLDAQALITELAVERFISPVLPGIAGIDDGRFDVRIRQPLQDRVTRDEDPYSAATPSCLDTLRHEQPRDANEGPGNASRAMIARMLLGRSPGVTQK